MRYSIFFAFLLSCSLAAGSASDLKPPSYQFDPVRIKAAKNPFKFFRSFVEYFYLLAKNNKQLSTPIADLESHTGWCIGDAHIENFAYLIQKNGTTVFTVNDIDDAGPCPVIYDFFRFAVGSRLYSNSIELQKLLSSYHQGLTDRPENLPNILEKAKSESERNAFGISKKIKNNRLPRAPETQELSAAESSALLQTLKSFKNWNLTHANLVDAIASQKIGGGSSGLKRYELLISLTDQIFHLELKEQVVPSIQPIASDFIPSQVKRIEYTISNEQGPEAHPLYGHLNYNGSDFLVRPKFTGNLGVEASKAPSLEDLEVIYYEAYTMGQLHRKTVRDLSLYAKNVSTINEFTLLELVELHSQHFNQIYSHLKKENP